MEMYEAQDKSFTPLWRNPSHTEMRKKREYVNYQLLYFIIFYAILLYTYMRFDAPIFFFGLTKKIIVAGFLLEV